MRRTTEGSSQQKLNPRQLEGLPIAIVSVVTTGLKSFSHCLFLQNCTDGESKIKEIFSVLDGHLKTREQDLVHELEDIRRTAGKEL